MKTTAKKTFVAVLLTALGVLPVPADAATTRSPLSRLSPLELELATVVAAIKQTYADIRAGRLGH